MNIEPIAYIHTDLPTKFGLPRQSGIIEELKGRIVFEPPFRGLVLAEVEFSSEEEANAFTPPEWFGEDVTFSSAYHNSTLSRKKLEKS